MSTLSTRPIAAIPALLLVAVSLWEAIATRRDAGSVPDDDAWETAAHRVRTEFRPGDLIVFAPEWVDPVGRLHLGDLMSVDMAARMDAAKYPRVWELSIRGAHAPESDGMALASNWESNGIEVRRYEQTPVEVVSDVRDRLPPGAFATLELAEVGFAPHRCIQVQPSPGQPVRLAFPQLTLGTRLVGYVGLADVFTRRDIRAPGKLVVEVAGRVVASIEPGVDDGWVRFEVTTTPGLADIAFVASADAPQRKICFAAEARR